MKWSIVIASALFACVQMLCGMDPKGWRFWAVNFAAFVVYQFGQFSR